MLAIILIGFPLMWVVLLFISKSNTRFSDIVEDIEFSIMIPAIGIMILDIFLAGLYIVRYLIG